VKITKNDDEFVARSKSASFLTKKNMNSSTEKTLPLPIYNEFYEYSVLASNKEENMRRGFFIGLIIIFIVFVFIDPLIFGSPFDDDLYTKEKTSVEELEKTLKMAVDQFKKGDPAKTLNHLAEAIMVVRNSLDLHLAKLDLCSEVRDYRDIDAKEAFEIKAGEPLLLYIEPDGYQLIKEGDAYKIWVSQDASISNDKGEVIFQKNSWVNYKRIFPTPISPFYLTNRVRDIPAGKYTYTLTLKDHYKNSFFTKTFDFVVK
jgi:hypothetical protein